MSSNRKFNNYILPPYSPQLNPAERFFGELREVFANKTYKNIEEIGH